MSKLHNKDEQEVSKQAVNEEVLNGNETDQISEAAEQVAEDEDIQGTQAETDTEQEIISLREKCADLADKNLRMMAEFDNYRRRTTKEKLDLMTTAGERIFKDMLPLIDDFERALTAMKQTEDINALREGIDLIYNKFITFLEKNNIKSIETENADFDTEFHEAVTTFPAPTEEQKGKIIDCTQKGYTLGEKVIRYAKVVVGE